MSNQIIGRLAEISQPIQMQPKNGGTPFFKRDVLLDATTYNTYTGEPMENIIPLEFYGDRCANLDRFKPGDMACISFFLQGRSWTNQQGELKRMVSIRPYKIEPYGNAAQRLVQQQPAQQPQYAPQPQQASQQPVQQQYASAPPAQQPQPSYPYPGQGFPPPVDANGNVNDLPF